MTYDPKWLTASLEEREAIMAECERNMPQAKACMELMEADYYANHPAAEWPSILKDRPRTLSG